ncbi:MAG TPA: sigma-70 family RNA polymerase sigma factor [Polyangiales bacterium]|jgi:RNA polymerase sigma-70 factor (ECF subfamily)|nr:sigma-70 family RNA polymerase sigma factor [Polyangiales bacterium]
MPASEVGGRLGAHREHLWGVCYRMLGSAADADDLVQETFRRALEAPPADLARDLRPWLVRVAVNLSRDALRLRKRRGYDGTWLPSPIETAPDLGAQSSEAHYGQLESLSLAFLIALEALTPTQRAVLLLRDVLDYSVRETAEALELSDANVKTTLHRARKAMADYGSNARPPTRAEQRRTREKLEALCVHLLAHNLPALEALLADDVRAHNDGAGEFFAARKPVVGKDKVIKFHLKTASGGGSRVRFAIRMINGMPALVGERVAPPKRVPPRFVTFIQLDAKGRITRIDTVVATRKLSAMRWNGLSYTGGKDFAGALKSAASHPPLREWAAPLAKRAASAATKWLQKRKRRR